MLKKLEIHVMKKFHDKTCALFILAFYKKVFCWVGWKVSNGGGYQSNCPCYKSCGRF